MKNDAFKFFREAGRRGGKTAAARMTKKQRTERARKAGLARQEKTRKEAR